MPVEGLIRLTTLPGFQDFHHIEDALPDPEGDIVRPFVPLRGQVIFPGIVSPIPLERPMAAAALSTAAQLRQTVIAATFRDPDFDADSFALEDLYNTGIEIAPGRILNMPDGTQTALGQGRRRVSIVALEQNGGFLMARARVVEDVVPRSRKLKATMQVVSGLFKRMADMNENISDEVLFYILNADTPAYLADLVASTLTLPLDERQRIFEIANVLERLDTVGKMLGEELNVLELKDEITGQLQQEMDRSQREIYLREQMRIIQGELGEDDPFQAELREVREQIDTAQMPDEIRDKAVKELARLSAMTPMAPEVGMVRSYIDWLTGVPWSKRTEDRLDVRAAAEILDREHYGLSKIKDRILEYIAVRRLAPENVHGPILCFVGPPGVGKTSLGKSIAAALGREFVRVSLGGVRDEAEIRGHRRTYIGALPGRIIQTMRRAGTVNPVFMLDEIDKLGTDFRGDPASALLEILDPEQNNAFSDHYLDVPYDLSRVLFITTANDLETLPPALLDRLEVIEFTSYTDEEKLVIARQFLIPREMVAHGIQNAGLKFEASGLSTLLHEYTYEAGVRNLDREIANVSRKVARMIAEDKPYPHRITQKQVYRLLGPAPFDDIRANDTDSVGVATGLAWTPFGGDVLTIEVSVLAGKGTLLLTGSLGEVMQESAQTALSYLRGRAEDLALPNDDFDYFDVHVHLPEGAVPKDGPSAGVTLAIAIISAFTERKVRCEYAMTGEVTLRGKILPVGGVKEKILAARRARLSRVILPRQNERDLQDLPREALRDMQILLVDDMQQVMDAVLHEPPAERRLDKLRREREDKGEKDED
jgi:ATP-dependent Lon protease